MTETSKSYTIRHYPPNPLLDNGTYSDNDLTYTSSISGGTDISGTQYGGGSYIVKYSSYKENNTNLIARYKFDNNATNMLLDSTGNGNNLTNNGSTFDNINYKVGNGSVYLNGNSQYISIPSTINPYTIWNNNGITFSLWSKLSTSSGSSSSLLSFGDITNTNTDKVNIIEPNITSGGTISAVPIGTDYKYLAFTYQASLIEQKTGVGGWRLVRFLPPSLGRWYTGNYMNTTTIDVPSIGTPYDYTNEWAIPFGTFDEMVFGTFDMTHWVQCAKSSVIGVYNYQARNVIKSSAKNYAHTVKWWNRNPNGGEDPWISINDMDTDGLIVYGENSFSANGAIRDTNGGMAVWVRDSTATQVLQTSYTVNFPENAECDILIVGGGGGGSAGHGGGGGAGQLVLIYNAILNGTYNVNVGKGGTGGRSTELTGGYAATKGGNSTFSTVTAEAGGTNTSVSTDKNGGSGAGGDYWTSDGGTAGFGIKDNNVDTFSGGIVYTRGNDGAPVNGTAGGGGGGAGMAGNLSVGGDGLSGINEINFDFRTKFGTSVGDYILNENKVYFAGGGGGGANTNTSSKGGGGAGSSITANVFHALQNTGGGGGGGAGGSGGGGNGGSGIVLVRYKLTKTVTSNIIEPNITSGGTITPVTFGTDYKYLTFTNKGENQTVYTVNFPENAECDILVVGGGGSGGVRDSGGGGGGGVVLRRNYTVSSNTTVTISVGKGGNYIVPGQTSNSGFDSSIVIGSTTLIAIGGGGGGGNTGSLYGGRSGGSGGGGGYGTSAGTATQPTSASGGYGNNGSNSPGGYVGGGGGGAGSAGKTDGNENIGRTGGDGIDMSAIFGTMVGHNGWFAGGGGSGGYSGGSYGNGGADRFGGASKGESATATDAMPNTGGGGGSVQNGWSVGDRSGGGGSGVVIIRYKLTKILPTNININNLVAYYKFNDSSSLGLDSNPSSTKYNLTPTIVGGTGGYNTTIAIEGASFQATNDGDRLEGDFPLKSLYDSSTTGISISCWYYKKSASYDNIYNTHLFHFHNPSDANQWINMSVSHYNNVYKANFSFSYISGETYCSGWGPVQAFDTWYHVVLILTKSGNIKVYLNGTDLNLVSGTTDGTIRWYNSSVYPLPQCPNTTKLKIFTTVGSGAFNGNIDEFYVFNKELTQTEVTSLYNKTITSNTLNIIEPNITSGGTITPVPIGTDYKYLEFSSIPDLIHNFTDFNTEATWRAKADSIQGFTYSFAAFFADGYAGMWSVQDNVGYIEYQLPSSYNNLTVNFGNLYYQSEVRLLINGVVKKSATAGQGNLTHTQSYNAGDILRVEELYAIMNADLIITLTKTTPNLIYDFSSYNSEATWKTYAATIPNFTYSLDTFLTPFDNDAVWMGNNVVGWIQMTLPSTHNFLSITYGLGAQGAEAVRLLINGVQKSSATTTNRLVTYSQAYNVGDVVRIEETFSTMNANIIITLTNTNTNQTSYTVNFPTEGTECSALIVGNPNYTYLQNLPLYGTYNIIVGNTSSITKSDNSITYNNSVTAQTVPFTNTITDSTVTYNLVPKVILRYKLTKTITSNSLNIIEPATKGIKQYPETASTNADSWTDNGFNVVCKTSDAILGTSIVCYLFNNLIAHPDHYHSTSVFNGSSPYNYTGSTSFKGTNGLAIYIDLGRSIVLRNMRIAPRDNSAYGLDFISAMPKTFKIYASNDSACWTSNTHASWTEIHSQTTSLTYNYNQFTNFGNFSTNTTAYRYFAMVVYNLAGSYTYLTFSEWDIFGTYDISPVPISYDYKYLSFTHSGETENQTSYTVNFPENTECDILVVGGGGGGGQQNAGGGGAGGLVLIQNFQANGSYTINVGKGGAGGNGAINYGGNGSVGNNSTFIKSDNSVIITANGGGGGGGGGAWMPIIATNGGSGGGGGWASANGTQTQKSQSQTGIISPAILNQFGEDGGHGGGDGSSFPGGGGGGAGGVGATSGSYTTGQNGGLGIDRVGTFVFSDKFSSSIGDSGWFAGGGGSGGDGNSDGYGNGGNGLFGGGGGNGDGIGRGINGINGTGGGGGSIRDPSSTLGGNGGSGIVLIRYKFTKTSTSNSQNESSNWIAINKNSTNNDIKFEIQNSAGTGSSYTLSGYSYNNGLVSGAATDSASTTYVNLLNLGITSGSTLINWSFYTSIAGRSITPLILEDTGSSNYVIRGIGTSRTVTTAGLNSYSFGLVEGTNVFINSNYRFGWKDGTTTSTNQGVISFSSNNAVTQTTYALGGNSSTNISLNSTYNFGNQSLGNRTYSFKLDFNSTTSIIDNIWHHIVWSISSTGVWSIYIDNQYINSNITRSPFNVTYARQYIGKSLFSSNGWLIGNIDDLRIYNKVLTTHEIASIYSNSSNIYPLIIFKNDPAYWSKIDISSSQPNWAGNYELVAPYSYIDNSYLVNNFTGDYVTIKLPYKIYLTKYVLCSTINKLKKAPQHFSIYGSVDGVNWNKIVEKHLTQSSYINTQIPNSTNSTGYYTDEETKSTVAYDYYGIVVNKLIGPLDASDNNLSFSLWNIYGTNDLRGKSYFEFGVVTDTSKTIGSSLNDGLIRTNNSNIFIKSGNVSTPALTLGSNNKVAIGKNIANEALDISGSIIVNEYRIKNQNYPVIDASSNITTSGNINISGNLTLNNNKFVVNSSSGKLSVAGSLDIYKNININNGKTIIDSSGNIKSQGNLDLSSNININNYVLVDASGSVIMNNTLDLSNNATLRSNLDIKGNIKSSAFSTNSSINKVSIRNTSVDPSYNFHVTGSTRLEGNLDIDGNIIIVDTVQQTSEQFIINNDGNTVALTVKQIGAQPIIDLRDDGKSVFYLADNGLLGLGTTTPSCTVDVSGSCFVQQALDVSGNLNIGGNTYLSENILFNDILDVSRNLNINNKFSVDPSGNIDICGNMLIYGYLISNGNNANSGGFQQDGNAIINGELRVLYSIDISQNLRVLDTFIVDTSGNIKSKGKFDLSSNLRNGSNYSINTEGNVYSAGNIDISKNFNINNGVFSADVSGNIIVNGFIDISKNLYVNGNKFTIDQNGNITAMGNFDVSQNLTINTNKFIVDASGNIKSAGNLDITNNFIVNNGTFKIDNNGNISSQSNFDISGNMSINGSKFTASNTGNIKSAGTLDISNNFSINNDNFAVDSSGNTIAKGNIDISNNLSIGNNKFNVDASGNIKSSGTLDISKNLKIGSSLLTVDHQNKRVGINTTTPEYSLDVSGQIVTNKAIMGSSYTLDSSSNATTTTTTSNSQVNIIEPQSLNVESIYPPYRYFTYNDANGIYTVQNGSMEAGNSTNFSYTYSYNDPANTQGNNEQTSSTIKNTHGMGLYKFSVGGTQHHGGTSGGLFIYALSSDYGLSTSGNRPAVNYDDNPALPDGSGWYVGAGWTNSTTYNSSYYYNATFQGAWIKIEMPNGIILSSFKILGGVQKYRSPKAFKIYGSNTNTTIASDWTLLHTETNYTYNAGGDFGVKQTVNNNLMFKNYLLVVSEQHTYDGGLLVFQGWYIYGKEEIKPVTINNDYKYFTFTNDTPVIVQKTGVGSWRLVRFLPPTATAWHPTNDNLAGTLTYGTAYNNTNAWSIPFGTYDEFVFGTLNLQYWMYITKTEAIGANYSGVSRNIIKSSFSSTPYSAIQYNRTGLAEDPWMSIKDHLSGNPADQIVYGENSYAGPQTALISVDGGMGVWVRNSADAQSLSTSYTYSINFPTEGTECSALIIGNPNYTYLQNLPLSGTYNIVVGNTSSITKSDNSITYNNNVTIQTVPFTNTITDSTITYNLVPKVILRYKLTKTITTSSQNIIEPTVSILDRITKNTGMTGWVQIKHLPGGAEIPGNVGYGRTWFSGNTFNGSTVNNYTVGNPSNNAAEWSIPFDSANVEYYLFYENTNDFNSEWYDRWAVIRKSDMVEVNYPNWKPFYKALNYPNGKTQGLQYNRINNIENADPNLNLEHLKKDGTVTGAGPYKLGYALYIENSTTAWNGAPPAEVNVYVKYTTDTYSQILVKKAEQVTGVKGWIHVKHLPAGSTTWYRGNDNLQGNFEYNQSTKLESQEWAIKWNDAEMNQVLFTKGSDLSQWLHVNSSDLDRLDWQSPSQAINNSHDSNKQYVYYRSEGQWTSSPYIFDRNCNYGNLISANYMVYQEHGDVGFGGVGKSWPNLNTDFNPQNFNYDVFVRNSTSMPNITPVSIDTDYKYLAFTNDGSNQTSYTVNFPENTKCDILVVGGGGAGGNDRGGGGGGGGVVYTVNQTLIAGTYTITVGKGGIGNTSGTTGGTGIRGTNGYDSSISGNNFTTITGIGGGAGGSCAPNGIREGISGGSGGGGSQYGGAGSGGSGIVGQGKSGGTGYEGGAAGGGGGFVNAGTNANSTDAGNGGIGLSNSITGTTVIYGSGGGGGGSDGSRSGSGYTQAFGTGGSSGAGNGANVNTNGGNGTSSTGCGGGGAGLSNGTVTKGGNGGSGIVIIRYKLTKTITSNSQNIIEPVVISETIERIYPPIRNATSNTTTITGQTYGNGVYIVSASSNHPGEEPFKIINTNNTGWTQSWTSYNGTPAGTYTGTFSLGGYSGECVKIQLPYRIKLTRHIIEASSIGGVNRAPSIYKIFGSNDDSNWVEIYHKSVALISSNYVSNKFEETISNTNYYKYYALVVNKNIGIDTWLSIGEWQIYGREKITPESIDTDYKYLAFTYQASPSVVLREYPPSAMTINSTTLLVGGTDAAGNTYGAGTYIINYPYGYSGSGDVYTLYDKLIGGNHTGSVGSLYNGNYIGAFCNDARTSLGTYFGSCTGTLNDRVWTYLSSSATGISIDLTQDANSNKYYGSTFTYSLPSPIYLQNLQLYNRNAYSTFAAQAPKSFRVYGMNIGDNGWTQIANYSNLNAWTSYTSVTTASNIIWNGTSGAENLTFKINANASYSMYGFVVNALLGSNENFTLAEIKLFGTDYYVPPSGQASHTVNFPENTVCDILVVGGGGAGGASVGGGGGAGGVVYQKNITLNGIYTIVVGKGGDNTSSTTSTANEDSVHNGLSSQIMYQNNILSFNGVSFEGKGGGGGGSRIGEPPGNLDGGFDGGSGGGNSVSGNGIPANPGSSTQENTLLLNGTNVKGGYNSIKTTENWLAGGGAGAGNSNSGMNGGAGIELDITGSLQWYAAGGGAGRISTSASGIGGSGIGGSGKSNTSASNTLIVPTQVNGAINTGSGGGGGGYDYGYITNGPNGDGGGAGGSGIVIIRYKFTKTITSNTQINTGYATITYSNDATFGYRNTYTTFIPSIVQLNTGQTFINSLSQYINFNFGNDNKCKMDASGNLTLNGDIFIYSDGRIKENVTTITSALDKVNEMSGITYNMINKPKRQVGVVAQEVEKVLPEVIKEEGGLKTVAYPNMVGLLIEALKELNDRVDQSV